MNAPPAIQQPIPLQQALQITNEVLGMMYKFYETAEDAKGHKVANHEVLLSLKHSQLLLRPYLMMMQKQPTPELPKRN
jgi:hypothetical protein